MGITLLDHDDLLEGLAELVRRAADAGIKGASVRIVGGAALRIAYFKRAATVDIDARIEPWADLEPIALAIAKDRGWPEDWLNTNASQFIPHLGKAVVWRTIQESEAVLVSVAAPDALLAMKLLAVGSRPGRDESDIAQLLAINGITSVDEAEELFEAFYPGDAFGERTIKVLTHMFEIGLPEVTGA